MCSLETEELFGLNNQQDNTDNDVLCRMCCLLLDKVPKIYVLQSQVYAYSVDALIIIAPPTVQEQTGEALGHTAVFLEVLTSEACHTQYRLRSKTGLDLMYKAMLMYGAMTTSQPSAYLDHLSGVSNRLPSPRLMGFH